MKKKPLLCLAALVSLIPLKSDAEDPGRSANTGTPTMAYYTKGRVIYYGYTKDNNSKTPYAFLLASNATSGHAAYQTPTMAYYTNGKVIRYGFTASEQHRPKSGASQELRDFEGTPQGTGPAISVVQPSNAVGNPPLNPIRMRTTTPLTDRESFEQEASRTKGTTEEVQAALQSSPVDAPGFYLRANAYKETNDYEEAIKDYGEVIRLDPENAYAYYKRALCYTALQRMDLAIENFRKANELLNGQQPGWSQPSHSRYPQAGY